MKETNKAHKTNEEMKCNQISGFIADRDCECTIPCTDWTCVCRVCKAYDLGHKDALKSIPRIAEFGVGHDYTTRTFIDIGKVREALDGLVITELKLLDEYPEEYGTLRLSQQAKDYLWGFREATRALIDIDNKIKKARVELGL